MRAAIFINYTIAPFGVGHVGWGFELSDGIFCYGAKEAVRTVFVLSGKLNGVFMAQGSEDEMLKAMRSGDHPGSRFNYHAYRYIDVPDYDIPAARAVVEKTHAKGYALLFNNCMDDVYDILTAYANNNRAILPLPATCITPRVFFDRINAPVIRL